jgi:tetratricopeptide (TPR) repeat protein
MTNTTDYEYDLFISYNRVDESWAGKLATRLEQEGGFKVFFAPWDILPGESIDARLEHSLAKSRKVGLIMSPESVASEWVNEERYTTHNIDTARKERRLIPLYRRSCDIPPFLEHIRYIDFREDDKFEDGYRALIAVLRGESLRPHSQVIDSDVTSLPPAIPRRPGVGFVTRRDTSDQNILEQLKEALDPQGNQLVVLWGRGGIGKTTLAAETVREMRADFPGRIVWVSALAHADLTISTLLNEIAAQLGRADLRPFPLAQKEEHVRELINAAPTLIVLDNFETIEAEEQTNCIDFLAERAPCPALITTRSDVDRDDIYRIPLEAMLLEEARDLLQRLIGRTRKPSRFDELNHDEIIQKTDFNPLLLTWVVKQIEMAQKPETALNYLKQGETKVAERIFDRSFNLQQVGDEGRAALLALSLFVPSASREALTEVAGFGGDLSRLDKAIERLAALWLVETTDDSDRLIIQGLTRELAKTRLRKDERAPEFSQRFVAYFLRYAGAHEQPTPKDYEALEAERDNLLGAMEVAFSLRDWNSVQAFAYVLAIPSSGMLYVHGYWDEVIHRNEQALNAARNSAVEREVAAFAHNAAVIYQARGELEEARQLYHESLEISKKLGDQNIIALTLHQLGRLAQVEGKLEEARRLYHESLEISRKLGDQNVIANTLHQLAMLAEDEGKLEEARQLYHESLEIKRRLSNQIGIANTLHQLGRLAAREGDNTEAGRLYREALSIFERLGSPTAEVTRGNLKGLESESE